MARSWYVAPSLEQLLREINQQWPGRSKVSDGGIGDAAHSARVSDHNPNERRSVNARDFTKSFLPVMEIIEKLLWDPRLNYIIYNRTIWSRSRNFVPRAYSGANPHTAHFHVSILQARWAEQDTSPWGISAFSKPNLPNTGAPGPVPPSTGGLFPMSNTQFQQVKDALDAIQHNTATAFGPLGGRQYIEELGDTSARRVWDGSYVTRGGKPIRVKQELADAKSNTVLILSELRAQREALNQLLKGQGVDMPGVQKAAKAGAEEALHTHEQTISRLFESLEMQLRSTIVESVNEIDAGLVSADPERFADEVLLALSEALARTQA